MTDTIQYIPLFLIAWTVFGAIAWESSQTSSKFLGGPLLWLGWAVAWIVFLTSMAILKIVNFCLEKLIYDDE